MKVIKVHKEFLGGTQVTVQAPEFENFGKRLDELERLADEANPIDPAEVQASTAQLMAGLQELQEKARKKLNSKPAGPSRKTTLGKCSQPDVTFNISNSQSPGG